MTTDRMETLAELQARLARAKEELREQRESEILVDAAGVVAEQILHETHPDADSIAIIAYHESGHLRMLQLRFLPAAAIRIEFADGRLLGVACPDWRLIDAQPTTTDAQNAGARLRACESVGVHLDLDSLIEKTEKLVRGDWPKIQRIGEFVASVCYSQNGNDWRVVVSAETLERLFWTEHQWRAEYGIEQHEEDPCEA